MTLHLRERWRWGVRNLEIIDYDYAAIGMRYFNNNNLAGVVVDGKTDRVFPGKLQWELITGSPGSIVTIQDIVSNSQLWQRCVEDVCELVIPPISSFYVDDIFVFLPSCEGDVAIGMSGQALNFTPNTDPRSSSLTLAYVSSRYYGPPGWDVAHAEQLRAFSENPLVVTVANY